MISLDEVRAFALSLPESEEKGHFDNTSFRTRNKIFATAQPEANTVVLKLPLDEQEAVTTMQPEVFSLAGWSHQGWTKVDLTKVSPGEFKALMVLAWRGIATKRAIKAYENQDA